MSTIQSQPEDNSDAIVDTPQHVDEYAPRDFPDEVRGSASLVSDYQVCPAKAYGRITRQVQQSKGIALVQGIAIHTTLEKYITERSNPADVLSKTLALEAERGGISLENDDGVKAFEVSNLCVDNGIKFLNHVRPDGSRFVDHIDPEYVEKGFSLRRNGKLYVGKIDLLYYDDAGSIVLDWKSGKTAPTAFKMQENLQFSIYAWAAASDPELTKTYGQLPKKGVYVHLRGQNTEKSVDGRRLPISRKTDPARIQYSFTTERTHEQIDRHFADTIDPVMDQIAEKRFYRNVGDACSWCNYFDKTKERCTVELPNDLPKVLGPNPPPPEDDSDIPWTTEPV